MSKRIKIVAQIIDVETDTILEESPLFNKVAERPKDLDQLGFTHQEQITILQHSQAQILALQEELINSHALLCPNCGKKTRKRGKFTCDFHAILTDHKIQLQRTICACGWTSKISIDGTYGSALHPDLVALQSMTGAQMSFQKAESCLERLCCSKRPINNHSRLQKTVMQTGGLLESIKRRSTWPSNGAANNESFASELTLVIDGAHLSSNTPKNRSFEAMTATVYNPKNVVKKDKNHHKIHTKTVVASAKSDHQCAIKSLIKQACLKQGLTKETTLTVLTDGAKNCWSTVVELQSACKKIITILDWFHIGKKFKNTEHLISSHYQEDFKKAKWCLWHGDIDKALLKLKMIQLAGDTNEKMKGLIRYIKNNRSHLVNYQQREKNGEVFTSQLAESTVNNLVNERQKHDKRMQWSRGGADAMLQIRSSIQSNDWLNDWALVKKDMYKQAI